ncbi:tetratricopeptide repeat protein [Micromonospora terminaliae]|uniref:Tetratricopeptide repeat protein n=1 Tax=Micromonospora terminaliae TaxID=1914461 RepID=A0AAJ2ZLI5_9ACTN|nr:tetratricopeptide repeat protein [Micromonospora terminaliae]NES31404.1 tetratricopeptide repeat protein [Micromonospora terminaliae]QGL49777.1 tetratricopeptide repeat protein [Micromonospora terminaliae]
MPHDATPDQSAADGYLQRAQLLAELGRYDEAAEELDAGLAVQPGSPEALTMLARVHLAADRPAAALPVAEAAVAAAPGALSPLVARGFALVDLGRWKAAASTGDRILALGPADAYAQRSAAAILAGARNGQPALNAAWRGVELAPDTAQAHLVLGVVAARLELYDLAERAYREALRLDPEVAEARHDMGVIRLEQRRYAQALEDLAEVAALDPTAGEPRPSVADGLLRLVLHGAGWSLLAGVLVAVLAPVAPGPSRLLALLAALGGALLVWRSAARVPGLRDTILPGLFRTDRGLALAVCGVAAAPALLVLYALVGGPWPLVAGITVALVAGFVVLARTGHQPRR